MKKRFLPLCMLLITIVLAQASLVANAGETQGKYTPRDNSNATFSSFMKSIRANQETGLIDPAWFVQNHASQSPKDEVLTWFQAGPDNYGGETRAVIVDNEENVIIGTVGGYIFKTTNGGITYRRIGQVGYPISCFVIKGDDLYIGTGDGFDAQSGNGLSDLGYETSFVGNGVYMMDKNGVISQIAGTDEILFVNEMTVVNGSIYAATSDGLMKDWNVELEGNFRSVKSNNFGDILAADLESVYFCENGGEYVNVTDSLPATSTYPKVIAMAKDARDYMYIAFLQYSTSSLAYSTGDIYFTRNGGKSWDKAFTTTGLYNIFGSRATHSGFMTVCPGDSTSLLIGSDYLWSFYNAGGPTAINTFRPVQVSEYECDEYATIAWNRIKYLHQGTLNIVFSNTDPTKFYIGTDGGIFKGEYYDGIFSYKKGNRYFITPSNHTSTTRMMSVAVGGGTTTLGGSLDNGAIVILANDTVDNVTTGKAIFPNAIATNNTFGYFTNDFAGGPCAISTIDPNIMFVSGTGALEDVDAVGTVICRTQTMGEDYDLSKFNASGKITNKNAFRTPFKLFENYDDRNNPVDTLELVIKRKANSGEYRYYYSNQAGYPIKYQLGEPPHDSLHQEGDHYVWIPGDTIRGLHDYLSTTMVIGIKNKLYMTKDALIFNKDTEWLLLSNITGTPSAVAMSENGDEAFVGLIDGKLYKATGLSTVYTQAEATAAPVTQVNNFGQAVTSVYVKGSTVVVTLGNYGNNDYVYLSTDGGETFASIQYDLDKAPVYSSLIEMNSNVIFIGNEQGVYKLDGQQWKLVSDFRCPVMELTQAIMNNHADIVDVLYDEMGVPTYVVYPGIHNQGMIYAATYGNGILGCAYYKVPDDSNNDVPENYVEETKVEVNVYPNPVRGAAQFSFNMTEGANVSYQVFDYAGRMVASEDLGFYGAGEHNATLNVENLANGSYIIRVLAGNKMSTAKFLVY